MSLAIKYESIEDARMRLKGTVVLYQGDPVYVTGIEPGRGGDDIFRVYASKLPYNRLNVDLDDNGVRKYISSKHFDIGAFKMGYVNSEEGAFFCRRLPTRQQKQGLSVDTFQATYCNGQPVSFQTFLTIPEVPAMVHNIYPLYEECLHLIKTKKTYCIAFSREFALGRSKEVDELVYLEHKGDVVGATMGGPLVLGNKFHCLKERLSELGVKV